MRRVDSLIVALFGAFVLLIGGGVFAPADAATEVRTAKTPDYKVGYLGDTDKFWQFWFLREQADGTGTVLEEYSMRGGDCPQYNDPPAYVDQVAIYKHSNGDRIFKWGDAGGPTWPLNDSSAICGEHFVGGGNTGEPEQIKFSGKCLDVVVTILDINVKNYAPDPYYASWSTLVCL